MGARTPLPNRAIHRPLQAWGRNVEQVGRERAIVKKSTVETEKIPRLLPSLPLPGYTHTPGSGTPHPFRDPKGHSYGRKFKNMKPLEAERWAENRSYLMAIDLFNHGYYWESHEEWERLHRVSQPDSLVGKFLKGLVKLSAAGMKVREYSIHGVRRHAASAGEVFADVAADSEADFYCGLEFTQLQFAADRAAQLTYADKYTVGEPVKVFPFTLVPDPMPLE